MIGLLLLQQFMVWMTAVLARVSLQTVLGEGFAPAVTKATLRSSLPLFWPVLGLSLLQGVAVSVVQSVLSVAYYAAALALLFSGIEDERVQVIGLGVLTVVSYLAMAIAYGYLSLTVPALATESSRAPAWIGKPAKPTTVFTAFERSIRLVGKKNLIRVALVFGGLVLICLGLIGLVGIGAMTILLLFARAINVDVGAVLTNPWTIFGLSSVSVLVAMSAILAYAAAVQSLLYLDLRMRREGLDLAMRFDCTSHRSLIVILTGLDEAAITEGLVPVIGPLRRKHKIVIAAVSDPRTDELAVGRDDAGQVYAAAAAESDRMRRARTARDLRNLGISVVQSPPERFAPDLADHYLALKKAGQL